MDQESETLQKGHRGHVRQRSVQGGCMDQNVIEIRVDQDTPGMKETQHRGQNLGENPAGVLEPKWRYPELPMLGAHCKPPELLRDRSHPNMQIGILKINLCQEIPRRDQRNHLTLSGKLKMQGQDKAIQKLQVDDQTKIPCDLSDHEDIEE
ncbi:hypothetical protein NDU88_007932 [Pleurodeles waltl]|uniref:Prolactin receptor n=1 Tax=Pleurodeles waltl TaxID=8319 RepID=A0AAV7RTR6_PLEWA|nr:hypothetical protein NDU88_007932 [Pleurodeles waltl]